MTNKWLQCNQFNRSLSHSFLSLHRHPEVYWEPKLWFNSLTNWRKRVLQFVLSRLWGSKSSVWWKNLIFFKSNMRGVWRNITSQTQHSFSICSLKIWLKRLTHRLWADTSRSSRTERQPHRALLPRCRALYNRLENNNRIFVFAPNGLSLLRK